MSTFTNFGFGPVDGPSRSDWRSLITEYKTLLEQLGEKQDKLTFDNTPQDGSQNPVTSHGIYQAINSLNTAVQTIKSNINTKADKADLDNKVTQADIANFVTATAVNDAIATALESYYDKQYIDQLKGALVSEIATIKAALEAEPFEKVSINAELLTGLVHAFEQIQFTFKEFTSHIGGTNDTGVYYIIGMLDKRAGTAYIKYTNTTSFAAVINFALSRESSTGPFTTGYLSVVTNAKFAGLHHLKFYIVSGTRNGEHHAYLAIQADEWLKQFASGDGYGLFDNLKFEGAGINFIPVDSEGYIAPNGETHVVSEFDYMGLEDRIRALEEGAGKLTTIGFIQGWFKHDENGVAIDVPENYHACDGTAVDPELTSLIEIIGPTYPKIDYHIIRVEA